MVDQPAQEENKEEDKEEGDSDDSTPCPICKALIKNSCLADHKMAHDYDRQILHHRMNEILGQDVDTFELRQINNAIRRSLGRGGDRRRHDDDDNQVFGPNVNNRITRHSMPQ